jgi:iron complex transport system permease protein
MVGDATFAGMAQRPGWSGMRAIRLGRVCVFTPAESDTMVRPGPRMAEALAADGALPGAKGGAMSAARSLPEALSNAPGPGSGSHAAAGRLAGGDAAAVSVLLLLALGVGSTGFESVLHAGRIRWRCRSSGTSGAALARRLACRRAAGLAGAVAQGLFRNPLADPYLLGSASGRLAGCRAGAGAGRQHADGDRMAGAAGPDQCRICRCGRAVLLTLVLARGVQHTLRLLLAGVVVGVVLGALGRW